MTKIATVSDILAHRLTRQDAFRVACPKCGANPSSPCIGRRSPPQERTSPHIDRYDYAAQVIEAGK